MGPTSAMPQPPQEAAPESGLMGEAEMAFGGELPAPQAKLTDKLHQTAVELLHGDMRDQTLKILQSNPNKLPEVIGQVSANLVEAMQTKIGGGLPIAVMLRLLMVIIIELIEIAQAMQLVSEDDEASYEAIIPTAIQTGAVQLSGQAKNRGVVNDGHIQEGEALRSKMNQGGQ